MTSFGPRAVPRPWGQADASTQDLGVAAIISNEGLFFIKVIANSLLEVASVHLSRWSPCPARTSVSSSSIHSGLRCGMWPQEGFRRGHEKCRPACLCTL